MAKLYSIREHPKEALKREKAQHWRRSRNNSGRRGRFIPLKEMAVIKHDEAVLNAEKKRGISGNEPNAGITECGCGSFGCFVHYSHETTLTQEELTKRYLDS